MDDDAQVITAKDLRRRYGTPRIGRRNDRTGSTGFEAVRGVSFSVRRGELFALLGTNGAGKTSALELVEGLARPHSGTVRVLGLDPFSQRRLLRPNIGIMLQDSGFSGGLTVAETARGWAGTLSTPRPVPEVLELVGLDGRERVTIRQLSGGEKRRLHLAIALLGRPKVLFLDEPTSGLDPESRWNTWSLVRGLLESGTTVVLTTHYLQEAEELADRLAILHHGRIVRTGSPAEVAAEEPATITFGLPATASPVDLPELRVLPGLLGTTIAGPVSPGSSSATVVTLRTRSPQTTLTALLGWASLRELDLERLSSHPATLEQAFLTIVASTGQDPGPIDDVEAPAPSTGSPEVAA
jgi:ABC-2 type transport system ATP-binding protein